MAIGRVLGIFLLAGWACGEISLEKVETAGLASFQHAGSTSEVVCHPDGVHVLSSSRDYCVRLWELRSGKLVRRFTEPGCGMMWGIRFVNEGKEFLAASSSKRVYRFEVATGKVLMTYDHPDDVYRLALHPDGKHFVAVGSGKAAILWELATGKKVRAYNGHTGDVYTAIVVEDGKRLITGSSDDTVKQWDLESGECLETLKEKPTFDDVFTLTASPDGKQFVMVSDDKNVRVFDSASLEEVWKRKLAGEGQVVAWSPDGSLVATASKDGHLYLLAAADGAVVRKIKTPESSHTPVTFSTDGKVLVSGGDWLLHLHDVETGERIEPGMGFSPHSYACDALVVGKGGRLIVTADGASLKIRDRDNPEKEQTITESGEITSMTLSDDGRFLAIGGDQGEIIIRETEGFTRVHRMKWSTSITSLDFSSGGSRLVSGGSRGAVAIWAVPTGKKIRDLVGHRDTVNKVAFHAGGEQVMTVADDRTLRVWSAVNGREQVTMKVKDYNPDDFLTLDEGRSLLVSGESEKLYGRILPKVEQREIEDPDQVRELVGQLGDELYQKREEAMQALAGFGREVLPLLEAVETTDPEVRARLTGVRNVMQGTLVDQEFKVVKEFDEDLSGIVADPRGRFWVGRLGDNGVEKIILGVIDHKQKGVTVLQTVENIHGCKELVFSPDGSHLGSINADGTTTLYRVVGE